MPRYGFAVIREGWALGPVNRVRNLWDVRRPAVWSTGGRLIGERQFRQPSDKSGEVWNVRFQMRLLIGFFPGVSPKAPWVRAEEWRPQVLRTVIGRSAGANSGQYLRQPPWSRPPPL